LSNQNVSAQPSTTVCENKHTQKNLLQYISKHKTSMHIFLVNVFMIFLQYFMYSGYKYTVPHSKHAQA